MASVNRATILGNLGKDPETRYLPDGKEVCNFSVATTTYWTDKGSGQKKEETEWHRITCYGRTAEIAGQYLEKGKPVYVEGRIRTRKWEDKDGVTRYSTEIIADSIQLLGSRDGGSSRPPAEGSRRPPREQAASGGGGGAAPEKRTGGKFDDMEDDIPF